MAATSCRVLSRHPANIPPAPENGLFRLLEKQPFQAISTEQTCSARHTH
jgi:hypothetical protein